MASNIQTGGTSIDDYFVRKEFFQQGNLHAWGYGLFNQNGSPSSANLSSPVQISRPGLNWKTLSNGYYFCGGIKTDGTLWVWGSNDVGQMGVGNTTSITSPVQNGSDATWKHVSCGYKLMHAVKTDGTLWAWGRNYYGGLGVGDSTDRSSPVQSAATDNGWKTCVSMVYSGAALKLDNTLWTWGQNNVGQLGDGTANNKSSPAQIGTNTWKQISAGGGYLMGGIRTDGTLWMWGSGANGGLGNNSTGNRNSPVQTAAGGNNWKQLSVSRWTAASAIKTDGTLWSWGLNTSGQLGTNDLVSTSSPVQITGGGTDWKQVLMGRSSASAIKTDGTLWTWGAATNGQLGGGVARSSPVQIASSTQWSHLASSSHGYMFGAFAFV